MEFEISDNGGKSKAINVTGAEAFLPCMPCARWLSRSESWVTPFLERGGGQVLLGKGVFFCGAIMRMSHVTIRIQILLGSHFRLS